MFVVEHAGYPFDVLVAVGATDAELAKRLRRLGCELSENDAKVAAFDDHGKGRTVMLETGATILRLRGWRNTPDDWGHLAHEVFHAVEFLMTRIGIKLTDDSDEAFAYAIANLTKRIVAGLRK